MIKLLGAGMWGAVVALVAAYVASAMTMAPAGGGAPAAAAGKSQAAKEIALDRLSVPIIAEGRIQGYMLAKLVFEIDGAAAAGLPPLDSLLREQAFGYFFAGETIDLRRLARPDLGKVSQALTERVNARAGRPVVAALRVLDLNFVPVEQVRRGEGLSRAGR